jgi:triosephosphate isomerase
MRTPLFAANWKLHKTVREAVGYVRELGALLKSVDGVETVVAPPFTALAPTAEAARNTDIVVAAQDVYFEAQGAFTGEVSAAMVKETGAEYAIIGHSERRRLFGDTDECVNRKLKAALAVELGAIVCIGETLDEREATQTMNVLDRQLKLGLEGVEGTAVTRLVLAYEPVWAIGTGRNATAAEADEAHRHIRARLTDMFGIDAASRCRILYGGSVNPDNVETLASLPDVDGALVGGASLDVNSFAAIVTAARAAAI